MKSSTATMTALITALIVLSPIAAYAANGSVTVGTNSQSYTGSQSITISVTARGF